MSINPQTILTLSDGAYKQALTQLDNENCTQAIAYNSEEKLLHFFTEVLVDAKESVLVFGERYFSLLLKHKLLEKLPMRVFVLLEEENHSLMQNELCFDVSIHVAHKIMRPNLPNFLVVDHNRYVMENEENHQLGEGFLHSTHGAHLQLEALFKQEFLEE